MSVSESLTQREEVDIKQILTCRLLKNKISVVVPQQFSSASSVFFSFLLLS